MTIKTWEERYKELSFKHYDDRYSLQLEELRELRARVAEQDALLAALEAQEPVAYGDRLGTHLQCVYAIPNKGVPPWMQRMTPLYLAAGANHEQR